MKERPILFNTEMVKGILEDRKSMTRRVVKNACDLIQDTDPNDKNYFYFEDGYGDFHKTVSVCPYGKIGDLLWVRETFKEYNDWHFVYKADGVDMEYPNMAWKPSIFMPKKACRIWLKIKDIRVEYLNAITRQGIVNEGVCSISDDDFMDKWITLWDSINGKPRKNGVDISWEANPYVWVVEFKRIDK